MTSPTLYHLTNEVLALEDLLQQAIDSGDAADAAAIDTWLAELDGSVADKLARVGRWRATELALAAAAKEEAKRLADRAKGREARVDRLDAAVQTLMERLQTKKVDTDVATFALQKPGGKAPVEVDDGVDFDTLPDDCVKTTKAPVKDAIRARLEAGEKIDGCRLAERGLMLRVK